MLGPIHRVVVVTQVTRWLQDTGPGAWEHRREQQLGLEGPGKPQKGLARKFPVAHEDRSAWAALSQPGSQPLWAE